MPNPKSKVHEVRVPGPLAPFAAEFKLALLAMGYTPLSAVVQLRLMVHLSRWLERRQLSVAELSETRVDEYLAERRAEGYQERITRRGAAPLLSFLAERRVLPTVELQGPGSPAQELLAGFQQYLVTERGLAPATVAAYVARAGRFVAENASDGDVAVLTASHITRAVLVECESKSVGAAQYYVAALRSFLRFCLIEGLLDDDLSAAALTVTGRRSSMLPRAIDTADARALLRSCDRGQPVGRRDYAVLLLLLRLGLRAGEVAKLRLDDIGWRAGEIVVHGKGRRDDRLPLPGDIGRAIADYLRNGRPPYAGRELFVGVTAPRSALTREAIGDLVRRCCVRAGIAKIGPHRLRHTLACAMVRAEVPLAEIGQVLRHRSPVVTAIYARVDVDQLRSLAQPWPGGDR
jgi:site-specific recombinase XerD